MKDLSKKTWQIIRKMFPPDQQEEAGRLLRDKVSIHFADNAGYEQFLERIHFAILRLSKGHIDEIPLLSTESDYRDTLVGAGFGESVTEHQVWADNYLAASNQVYVTDPLNEPMEAVIYQENWVKCPNCGVRFSLKFIGSWAGVRHRSCGQRLKFKA